MPKEGGGGGIAGGLKQFETSFIEEILIPRKSSKFGTTAAIEKKCIQTLFRCQNCGKFEGH